MKTQFLWSLLLPLMAVVIHNVKSQDAEASPTLSEISSMVQDLKNVVDLLANQLMMQQLIVEEKARFDGASGIKQIRMDIAGTRPYHTPSHVRDSVAAYHDHANYDRTVGMGEISAVLNGVEFKTRHNDFKLVMPCTSDESYHCIENIPFPPVPPEVTSKTTVEEQIAEMKEWFKAFRDQNSYVRDYRKYFKPVMCYLEGTWTKISPDGKLEESFQSDRHALDATDWADLHQKTRFTSYSGRKSQLENFAFLPVAVMNITDGIPKMAQWNYRILCHPISKDISTSVFRVRDDLGSRLAYQSDFETHSKTRRARFQLNPDNSKFWPDEHLFVRGLTGLLDQIMEEIPGKNNYPAYLEDNIFDEPFYRLEPLENGTEVMLNAARYHRWYQVIKAGASGRKTRHRSYSDANVFMAMTDKDEVVGMTFKKCNQNGRDCKWADQKWSYAIPLEIIYLTPLSLWNPYNLKAWGKDPDKMVVTAEDVYNRAQRTSYK
ncbi:uncharacterized protein LOC106164197 [Lingula anatina]|uniref:Uncharacterized protein LOC106164197 n=1 Tax=Lingula anatina TaxID=7574 RepID=A0A1S3IGS5_LINAN|nr:uncharacterized protein LOC106164197 [Lingula anatina]|eukprot:XP_013397465.1 uncharacterized protein LOC106164197 [Lingula anatina]